MADHDILKKVINDELFVDIIMEHGRNIARLKECGTEAKLKLVKVCGLPDNSVLLNLDKSKEPKSLFKAGKGQRKRCDYVLFTELDGRKIMIFIELKSGRTKRQDIIRQFKGAECIIDYCESVIKRFYNHIDLFVMYEKRFVIFHKAPSMAQRTTRLTPAIYKNNKPESFLKIPNPVNLNLKELV